MALCERCKTDIALANEFDNDPRIDRARIAVIAEGEYRRLSAVEWGIFAMLYSTRGRVVMSDDLADRLRIAEQIRENVRRLCLKLRGTGFEIVSVRGFGYALNRPPLPQPSGRIANLQHALCGGDMS